MNTNNMDVEYHEAVDQQALNDVNIGAADQAVIAAMAAGAQQVPVGGQTGVQHASVAAAATVGIQQTSGVPAGTQHNVVTATAAFGPQFPRPSGVSGVQQTLSVGIDGSGLPGQVPVTSQVTLQGLPKGRISVNPERPEKFNGQNFKSWQMKMHFYLYQLGVVDMLKQSPPTLSEDESDTQMRITYGMWMESDYLCRNHIMNCLSDNLYKVYTSVKTARELWELLDKKYRRDDAGSKKYIVSRFLEFKMMDNKTVQSQMQELQLIYDELDAEDMKLPESFRVAATIEKLPSAWKDFKNYLKHKTREMSLADLHLKLKIEEENRGADKKLRVTTEKANVVEHGDKKQKTSKKLAPKEKSFKKQKPRFKGKCFKCGKEGHKADECRSKKKEVNVVDTKDDDEDFLVAMISELNLVDSSERTWETYCWVLCSEFKQGKEGEDRPPSGNACQQSRGCKSRFDG